MISLQDSKNDGESPIAESGLDHHGPHGTKSGAGANSTSSVTSSRMNANKMLPFSHPHGNGDRIESSVEPADPTTTQSTKPISHSAALLQVPEGGNGTIKRPTELSIWDWDPRADSLGDHSSSSSYHYEPQGELLQEQREQRSLRDEFNIPAAVSGSGINWPFQTPTSDSDGFIVPARPIGSTSTAAGVKRKSHFDQSPGSARPTDRRVARRMSESGEEPTSPSDPRPPAYSTRSQSGSTSRGSFSGRGKGETADNRSQFPSTEFEAAGGSIPGPQGTESNVELALPARKVFPIQIGDKLFRLSGASISSDAPSYFSQFFEEQLQQNEGADRVRTLYIDRDPATFEDIALHLQGYHIEPRDGRHFVKLFADAQFFSLPRLTEQLFSSTIYIRIGDEEFQIPRDLFSNPGDSPNFFSLGFSVFFTTPSDVFPGLSERTLLRPPSILPPSVPNKSAKTFADLMHILRGYPVRIESDEHREELLRDARYFHLKGLEQRLIPYQISYNLARRKNEIVIRLEDIRQSGVSFTSDSGVSAGSAAVSPASSTASASISTPGPGWISYQRPYVDSEAYSLIVEMAGEENTFLSIEPVAAASGGSNAACMGRATFHKQALARITSLFSVIASKMNLPSTQPLGLLMLERGAGAPGRAASPSTSGLSEDKVKVRIGPDADVVVDGKPWTVARDALAADDHDEDISAMDTDSSPRPTAAPPSSRSTTTNSKRRKRAGGGNDSGGGGGGGSEEWIVHKAQWRLRVQPLSPTAAATAAQNGRSSVEVILGAVKIEAFSNERSRNVQRGFLS